MESGREEKTVIRWDLLLGDCPSLVGVRLSPPPPRERVCLAFQTKIDIIESHGGRPDQHD